MKLSPELSAVSFLLGAVNCLPLYPLDGGRMLRSALALMCPAYLAEKLQHFAAAVVCSVLMVLACWATVELQAGLWPMFAVLVLLCRVASKE